MNTYRITYRDHHNRENTLPVIATSALKAVDDLKQLGFPVARVTHTFPAQ